MLRLHGLIALGVNLGWVVLEEAPLEAVVLQIVHLFSPRIVSRARTASELL